MATIAKGVATFAAAGAETSAFTWVDVVTGNPVTFASTPIVLGPFQNVTTGAQGPGVPYFATSPTTTGGTITMANPPDCTVVVIAVG